MKQSVPQRASLGILLVAAFGLLAARGMVKAAPSSAKTHPVKASSVKAVSKPSPTPAFEITPVRSLEGTEPQLDFSHVAFAPDGKWLASAASNVATFSTQDAGSAPRIALVYAVKIWDKATWKLIRTLRLPQVVSELQFSPDQQWLAVMTAQEVTEGKYGATSLNGRTTLTLYRTRDWSVLRRIVLSQPLCPLSFAPQSDVLAVGTRLLSTKTWQTVRALTPDAKKLPRFLNVASVSFAPDGRTLATYEAKGVLRLWQAATGKLLWTIRAAAISKSGEHHSADMPPNILPCKVTFAPDGKTLVTSSRSDEMVRQWSAATGSLIRELRAGNVRNLGWDDEVEGVSDVTFFPHGKAFVTSSEAGMKVWDVASGVALQTLSSEDSYLTGESIAFAPDGHVFAAASAHNAVDIWNVAH